MPVESETIICRTTRWYTRRRLLMTAMLLGLSAYFFYDWKVGYPAQQAKYEVYWPRYEALVDKQAADKQDLKTWNEEAKKNGWPEKPTAKDWNYKLKEQFIWGIGTGIIGLGLLGSFLVNRKKVLTGEAESFITPGGVRVPFSAVTKVDKRKWDNKGLAYVFWKDGDQEKKAVIDDLMFGGAVKVLDRLLANFHGDLIELERDEKPPDPEDPVQEGTETGGASETRVQNP